MGKIWMKIRAVNWSMGDIGQLWIQLKEGECRIDWGDGYSSIINAPEVQNEDNLEWVYARHRYNKDCKRYGETFCIGISTKGENIKGFMADCGEMMVESVNLIKCQELEYLKAGRLVEELDVSTNPHIKTIHVTGDAADVIDLSNSHGLVELKLNFSKRGSLDISKMPFLRYLDCRNNYDMTQLLISKRNFLETFVYYNTPLSMKNMSFVNYKNC